MEILNKILIFLRH